METESSSQDSDHKSNEIIKLMENKNPVIRLITYGKIKRMMNSYIDSDLSKKDKNLIRGLWIRKIKDFDEDYQAKLKGKTMYQRLHSIQINESIS